jgi:hypothetical protein
MLVGKFPHRALCLGQALEDIDDAKNSIVKNLSVTFIDILVILLHQVVRYRVDLIVAFIIVL